jgi:P22 coat protein - gene protein 5
MALTPALTIVDYTREYARILHNKLQFIAKIRRGYDAQFARQGAKIGDTLNIRLPNQVRVGRTETVTFDDLGDESVSLKVNQFFNTTVQLSASEMALNLNDWSQQFAAPSASKLAAAMEAAAIAGCMAEVFNQAGTPGTTPTTVASVLGVKGLMTQFLAPNDGKRNLIIDTSANIGLVGGEMKGLFQSSERIAEQYERGSMGTALGFDFYESNLTAKITNGNKVTGVTVSGAGQTGSTLLVGGVAAADTFKAGQIFTIAGVKAINPETKTAYPFDQSFVITADATAAGATVSLSISPPILVGASAPLSARDTVNSLPAAAAALTFAGTANLVYNVNIGFHEEAFTFATVDMEPLWGIETASTTREGIRMRISKGSDIATNKNLCRVDVLGGWKTIRPQFACRFAG